MTAAQVVGSTLRGGLLRGAIAGAIALLVVYGALFFTSGEETATAQAPCENGTVVSNPADNPGLVSDCAILLAVKDTLRGTDPLNWSADRVITSWEGITVSGTPSRVTQIYLDRNTSGRLYGRRITLTGTIPPELGELSKLTRLTLSRHELTGTIPPELGNLSELTDLQLYGNELTGGIPPELGNLANLTRLDLNGNPLGGSIPVELGKLTNLGSLRLLNNQLTGSIPASLGALSNLYQLSFYGNTGLTGCIPASLRGTSGSDLSSLGLDYCTTTTIYSLTTSAEGNGRISPLPGTYSYLSGASVTVTATPDTGHRVASWGDDCSASGTAAACALTMDANKTVSVTFARDVTTYTLTTSAGANGSIDPAPGTHTYDADASVTVTATPDAGYRVASWGGDCSGSGTASTCALTMDANKTASVTFQRTYTLTTSAGANGSIDPAAGTHTYDEGTSVTVTATPDEGYRIASWGDDCSATATATTCALTMDADRTASVSFERNTHTLTVTAGEGGSVTPDGTTTHDKGAGVTLMASWNDATHTFSGWGGDCSASGTASTCELTMDGDKVVTVTFAALPATRCAITTDADCIRAVYRGAPGDYAQVQDIPADVLITAAGDGRYYLEREQQITVVTAAPLPTGWTRFYLERSPVSPSPVSTSQLIKPIGTTYTFTVSEDEAAATLITFDLKQARPFVRPRPDGKPEIGDTVVTTVFSVEAETLSYNSYDTTGAVSTAGSYAFLTEDDEGEMAAVSTYEALRDGTTTALLIHKSDAHGASQAVLYDAVETGHLFEWHQADDCFVRYRVTDVPEAGATATHREFGVRWETYVFQGCQTGRYPPRRR